MTTSMTSMTPTGGDGAAAGATRALNQDEVTNVTPDLLDAVLARDNLWRAWKRVKANRGAPGIDGVRLEDFSAYARNHWPDVREQIEQGRYAPQPVRRVAIPKPDGGERLLGVPTILDRVIQQAIAQVLTPIFEPTFSASSFGFRPGRNAHQAIRQVQTYVKAGYRIAVDLDLDMFFDTVEHDRLMNRLGQTIRDQRLLALIGSYLRAGERVMQNLTRYLETRLKLKVNPAKSKVAPMSDCRFLGFTLRGTKIRWSDKALANFKHRVRELTGRSWGISMTIRLNKLGNFLRGWFGYFGISQYYRPIPELDEWLRRRVRRCYWKQWRWPRTKISHLVTLGVRLKTAIQHGVSSKSYWHMARTPAVQQALSNAWLEAQGLLSVKALWCKAQGYSAQVTSSSVPTR